MNEENDFTIEDVFECSDSIVMFLNEKKVPIRLGYAAIHITNIRVHHNLGHSREWFMEMSEDLCNYVYSKEEKE